MSVLWLTPIAWWGLAALSIPVLIHLLARQRSRRLMFPSLRFLRSTRLVALKRRRISDWPLLTVRLLIVTMAVAALAGPVFVSDARWRSWSTRTARAVVIVPSPDRSGGSGTREVAALTGEARSDAFVSATFEPTESIADGLRDAANWLARQAPAAREVVVLGDIRAGALDAHDFDVLTAATGIRLLPITSSNPDREARLQSVADDGGGQTTPQELQLTLADDSTTIDRRTAAESQAPVSVTAAASDQHRADAALRAVMAEGIIVPRDTRRLVIEFDGATPSGTVVQPASETWMRRALERLPGMTGGSRDGRLVVRPGIAAADATVAMVVARIVDTALVDDVGDLEPRRIPARVLAAWSRPAGDLSRDAMPTDEGDRRYFWAGVLILALIEQWLRRTRFVAIDSVVTAADREARVA